MSLTTNKTHAISLLLYIFISAFFIYASRVQKEVEKNTKNVNALKNYTMCFFTVWNIALQIIFMTIAILDSTAYLLNFPLKIRKSLTRIRSYTFTTLVFPVGLMVFSIFWILYQYDRELIFPKKADDFVPFWINHTLHTAIVVPILVELLLPKKYCFVQFGNGVKILTVYLLIYQTLYFSLFFKYGVWLYPIHKYLTWPQRIIFTLIKYCVGILYLGGGIAIQNLKMRHKNQ